MSRNTSGASGNPHFGAKLRRLKIQEDILVQSLKTHCPVNTYIVEYNDVEYYNFFSDIKKTFLGLDKLFDDVKSCTDSQETLKGVDIDDIKNSVFELENNIQTLKKYLQSEIVKLKSAETTLEEEIRKNINDIINVRKQTKVHVMPYSELIITSPVGVLRNSPFKCAEVQQFQEFMMNTQSRYGGWNEYHHNIFAKAWHKHFPEAEVNDPEKFHIFLHELLRTLQGFTEEQIVSHNKWYSEYVYLRERQQMAIDIWKSKRMKFKKTPHKNETSTGLSKKNMGFTNFIQSNTTNNLVSDKRKYKHLGSSEVAVKISLEPDNEVANTNELKNRIINEGFQYLKPTAQWTNRCKNNVKVYTMCNNDIWNIEKLRKPNWRLGL